MNKPYSYSQKEVSELKNITLMTIHNRRDELNWEGSRIINDEKLDQFSKKRNKNKAQN